MPLGRTQSRWWIVDMVQFRHYIITCLNVGIYSHKKWPKHRLPVDKWMSHRMRLFTTFTLPSMINQTCQNFTWLLLMDERTPTPYKQLIDRIQMKNLQPVFLNCKGLDNKLIAAEVMANIEPGDYDLMTTEVDSDDAIHQGMVKVLQDKYQHRSNKLWQISFLYGFILDTRTKAVFSMKYAYHCPTIIEHSSTAKSVYHWPNVAIPANGIEYISNAPYWLQIIHSQNVTNDMKSTPSRKIYTDEPLSISHLSGFGLNFETILDFKP